jgi:hypothetical protein
MDINSIIKQVGAITLNPKDDEKKDKKVKDTQVFGVSTKPVVKKRKRKTGNKKPKMMKESDLGNSKY